MAVRPVLCLPDPRLGQRCKGIEGLDETLRQLAADLVDTMRASPACVGLAAPQIGVGLRAFALDVTGHPKARSCHGEVVLFNPVVVEAGERVVAREGCMSVPDLTGDVARPGTLVVEGLAPDGRRLSLRCDAFEARAVAHEMDHLDGLVFLDRLVAPERVFRRKVYR